VLKNTRGRDLINYFTVVPAAHASFMEVPVRRYAAQALIHQVHRDGHSPRCQLCHQQPGVLRGHPRRSVLFTLHGPGQANDDLHCTKFLHQVGDDPDIGVFLRVPVQRFVRGGQD
jgi:hypothetical protein